VGRWSSPRYQELEGCGYEKGGMTKISAEGQGPPWAVEPVVMMMMMKTLWVWMHRSLHL
jgi:hypothetical protein